MVRLFVLCLLAVALGGCGPSEDDCRADDRCMTHGECTPTLGHCLTSLDADCRVRAKCYGLVVWKFLKPDVLKSIDTTPPEDAAPRDECVLGENAGGLPSPKFFTCIATEDDDCKATESCKKWGWCKAKNGRCVAKSDADCQASDICKSDGKCTAKNDQCVK